MCVCDLTRIQKKYPCVPSSPHPKSMCGNRRVDTMTFATILEFLYPREWISNIQPTGLRLFPILRECELASNSRVSKDWKCLYSFVLIRVKFFRNLYNFINKLQMNEYHGVSLCINMSQNRNTLEDSSTDFTRLKVIEQLISYIFHLSSIQKERKH